MYKRQEDNRTTERYANKWVDISDHTQGFLNWYENTYNNMVSFENETFEKFKDYTIKTSKQAKMHSAYKKYGA